MEEVEERDIGKRLDDEGGSEGLGVGWQMRNIGKKTEDDVDE